MCLVAAAFIYVMKRAMNLNNEDTASDPTLSKLIVQRNITSNFLCIFSHVCFKIYIHFTIVGHALTAFTKRNKQSKPNLVSECGKLAENVEPGYLVKLAEDIEKVRITIARNSSVF